MHLVSLFLLGLTSFFALCKTSEIKETVSEKPLVIEYARNFYEPNENGQLNSTMNYKDKVWYQDSMAIESVNKIHIASDKSGTSQSLQLLYYRFSDLKTNNVYEYDSFGDTAKLIRKYSYNDTTVEIINGWNFKFKRKWNYNGKPQLLSDTFINEINYKRTKLIMGPQTDINEAICYFRCDKNFQIFVLDSSLSKMIGCPFVKAFISSTSKKGISMSNEIVFLAEKFTPDEQRVFSAWKKYAEENPVIK